MKVLKFGADWCPGCVVMKPRWGKIEKDHPWLETEYYDIDENKELVEKYGLEKFPGFIFLDNEGNVILKLEGEIPEEELVKIIEENKGK